MSACVHLKAERFRAASCRLRSWDLTFSGILFVDVELCRRQRFVAPPVSVQPRCGKITKRFASGHGDESERVSQRSKGTGLLEVASTATPAHQNRGTAARGLNDNLN